MTPSTKPKQLQRATRPQPEECPDLVGPGLLEELLDLLRPHGCRAQSRLYALHPESEKHDQQRDEDGDPGSHGALNHDVLAGDTRSGVTQPCPTVPLRSLAVLHLPGTRATNGGRAPPVRSKT